MINTNSSSVRSLFQDNAMPDLAAPWLSPCAYFSWKEIKFLRQLWGRTDNNLFEMGIPEMDEYRHRLLALGYTDDIHADFFSRLDTPSRLTPRTIRPVLTLLMKFYDDLLTEEKSNLSDLQQQASSTSNVIPFPSIPQADFNSLTLQNQIANDRFHCILRQHSLGEITNNIRALLVRPFSAQIYPYPTRPIA